MKYRVHSPLTGMLAVLLVSLGMTCHVTAQCSCNETAGDVTLADVTNANVQTTAYPTWGTNHTKMVVKTIGRDDVAFVVVIFNYNCDSCSKFRCQIFRRIDSGSWTPWSCIFCAHQPPTLIIDSSDRLHAIFPDTNQKIRHLRFNDPQGSACTTGCESTPIGTCDVTVITTTGIHGGSDLATNTYMGTGYDGPNGCVPEGIWLVFNDSSWVLKVAYYNIGSNTWNSAATLATPDSSHAYTYPCIVAIDGDGKELDDAQHVLATQQQDGGGGHNKVTKFTRLDCSSWSATTVATGSPADETEMAVYGCDLVETDTPGEVIGLVYSNEGEGGPESTGVYIVGVGGDWDIGDGERVANDSAFTALANMYVDPDGRIWVIGNRQSNDGNACVSYRYKPSGSGWSSAYRVDAMPSSAPVTCKRQSGSDYLANLTFCYSTDPQASIRPTTGVCADKEGESNCDWIIFETVAAGFAEP